MKNFIHDKLLIKKEVFKDITLAIFNDDDSLYIYLTDPKIPFILIETTKQEALEILEQLYKQLKTADSKLISNVFIRDYKDLLAISYSDGEAFFYCKNKAIDNIYTNKNVAIILKEVIDMNNAIFSTETCAITKEFANVVELVTIHEGKSNKYVVTFYIHQEYYTNDYMEFEVQSYEEAKNIIKQIADLAKTPTSIVTERTFIKQPENIQIVSKVYDGGLDVYFKVEKQFYDMFILDEHLPNALKQTLFKEIQKNFKE